MGVLDDAIREHLELKRKHGASEGEIEQQEQEALGAPRGQRQAGGEAVEAPAPSVSEPAAAEPVADAAPVVEEPAPSLDSEAREGALAAEPIDEPAAGDTPPHGFEPVDDEPREDGEEDVLEETPEHDRLWFEQKPPRDFDFDE